ncbi:SDR family oxidoreductase [Naasia sp. SYSU D00057]|uniref:SDR family oxidoreductase n=1 Tax=Naasia sp. SYSU D00057 TaxID=2817380 RepID=UPI001B3041ED|nr:SDR family oxidoreductase [Naasia sp. SYSU D00057]
MRVFQIGAAGGVGRRLARLLAADGAQVIGAHRDPAQAAVLEEAGATPVLLDLISATVEELAEAIRGSDAVVFSAGAHGTGADKTTAIDGKGLEKAAEAARLAGVRRFLLVSVFPDAGRGREPSEGFEHYMRVKKSADVYLTRTDLDWVIVRPGTLTDEPGTGRVEASLAIEYGDVPRDDVAAFLHATLREPGLTRTIVELTGGGTPVDEAAHRLASGASTR